MGGECPSPAYRRLLIYVSDLSARLRQDASVKTDRKHTGARRIAAALAFAVAATAVASSAVAAEGRRHDADRRHDEVRQAVERGEIRPLADLLAAIAGRLPGEVVGVEIERKDGHWIYEFRVLDGKGRLFEVEVDARSGSIERSREK